MLTLQTEISLFFAFAAAVVAVLLRQRTSNVFFIEKKGKVMKTDAIHKVVVVVIAAVFFVHCRPTSQIKTFDKTQSKGRAARN